MGLRRLALLLLLAACPKAKPASEVTTPPEVAVGSAAPAPAPSSSSSTPDAAVPPSPPPGPVSNATLAEVGIEATSLDRSVDPCGDFYQFACGGWLKTNKIPDDRPVWSRFSEVHEKNLVALQALLDEAA